MNDVVRIESVGDVGLLCLNKPPVNALGVQLRTAVYEAFQNLLNDPSVKVIVLYGEGKYFSAGADIKDFARAEELPSLPELLKALNDSAKPVIASLHGVAFGGALELALATHLRVGIQGLKVGLPEVKLGLLPGAGGTQRLARLTGLAPAIDIICTGRDVFAAEAVELGILHSVENGGAKDAGIATAKKVLSGDLHPTATDTLSVPADEAVLRSARARFAGAIMAPLRAIDAVQAATLPIEEGLKKERELFMELMHSEEHAGLVHAFIAERATSKIPEQDEVTRKINSVGVVGGGTMGVGIATALLIAGLPVTVIEQQQKNVDNAHGAIKANLDGALKRSKLTQESHTDALKVLDCSADLNKLASADLVIEAIFENMEAKTALFKQLGSICKPFAILASNTSYLDINQIARASDRAADVIGIHFFSPAHIMRLLEVVVAEKTTPEVTATVFDLAKKIRKIPVRAGVCDGFIGNRILTKYRKACEYLLLDGAGFEQIDQALEAFGFAMGPFAVGDLSGLDIARASRDRKAATRPAEERYSRVADLLCDQGWFGRKTGRGYYQYEKNQSQGVNPGALEIVAAERYALGIKPSFISNDEIVARCLTAITVEAVRVLEDGIALRPVDVDAVQLFGYGFPRHRGGPMHMADQIGIQTVIERIEKYAEEDAYFWQVPDLLRKMQCEALSFSDLNKNDTSRASPMRG